MKKMVVTCLLSALAGLALAEEQAPAPTDAWTSKMTDPSLNASAFRDPQVFSQWTGAMMNPAMAPSMGMATMDPGTYTRMAYGMMSPAAFQNAMQFANPAIATSWAGAAMDPAFYNAMMAQAMNPANMMGWVMVPLDPRMMNMGMQAMNPGYHPQMVAVPMDPKVMGLMLSPANPQTYTNWMGAVASPATYPVMQMIPMQMPVPPVPAR